ncbi:MAG: hypothetical protein ACYDBB_05240 [Armatimonadota bacterium]
MDTNGKHTNYALSTPSTGKGSTLSEYTWSLIGDVREICDQILLQMRVDNPIEQSVNHVNRSILQSCLCILLSKDSARRDEMKRNRTPPTIIEIIRVALDVVPVADSDRLTLEERLSSITVEESMFPMRIAIKLRLLQEDEVVTRFRQAIRAALRTSEDADIADAYINMTTD